MNCIKARILDYFPVLQYEDEAINEVIVLTLRYIFRFISASRMDNAMTDILPDVHRSNISSYRHSITADGFIMMNIKQYLLQAVAQSYTRFDVRALKNLAYSLELNKEDAKLGKFLQGILYRELRDLTEEFKVLSFSAWSKHIGSLILAQQTYIRRAVTKKLLFLSTSQATPLSDFCSDIESYVLQQLMFMYPRFHSPLHAANTVKQIAQQRMMNIIKEGTAEKRARLYSTESGFESNTANLEAAMLSTELAGQTSMQVSLTGDHRGEAHFMLQSSVSHLLATYTGKKRLFLSLLMGEEHEGFTRWLRKRLNIKASSTNADWQDRTDPASYMNAVIKYLEIGMDKVVKFIETISKVLDINIEPLLDTSPRTRSMF